MRMTTQEAVWAATAGGARALRRPDVGHLGVGARADLILLDAPSHAYLAYRPGVPLDRRRLAGRPPGRRQRPPGTTAGVLRLAGLTAHAAPQTLGLGRL